MSGSSTGLARLCQATDSTFPIWSADRPLDSTANGFCEDAWSHFRKPGRDLAPTISLSLWLLFRVQKAIYQGLWYSKRAGDGRRLNSCPERRPNEICFSFWNLVNPSDLLIAGRRSHSGFVPGSALIPAIDLDGNGLEQPLKLGVVQVLERTREVAWEGDPRGRRRIGR